MQPERLNALTASTVARLCKALGREQGMAYASAALSRMGVQELNSAQDLLVFANYLLPKGGAVEAVARSLKILAILRGAVDHEDYQHC